MPFQLLLIFRRGIWIHQSQSFNLPLQAFQLPLQGRWFHFRHQLRRPFRQNAMLGQHMLLQLIQIVFSMGSIHFQLVQLCLNTIEPVLGLPGFLLVFLAFHQFIHSVVINLIIILFGFRKIILQLLNAGKQLPNLGLALLQLIVQPVDFLLVLTDGFLIAVQLSLAKQGLFLDQPQILFINSLLMLQPVSMGRQLICFLIQLVVLIS